ncbi:MAG: CDP-archaeol synthase [Gammaproteobacteria bacterium]|jgi:hypothetical protein
MRDLFFILLLIVAGNGAPILIRFILGNRMQMPVDFHRKFIDDKRIFGNSKTWIGLVSIPVASIGTAWLMNQAIEIGVLVGFGIMLGDLFSSFTKRRMNMKESSMAVGLDQIPESLFPLILVKDIVGLDFMQIVFGVVLFIIFELLVSRMLYRMHIRKQPY